jgi:hypothetical protein
MRLPSLLCVFVVALVVELAIVSRGFGLGAPSSAALKPTAAAVSGSGPLLNMGTTGRHETNPRAPAAVHRVAPASQRVQRVRDITALCDHAAATLPADAAVHSVCDGASVGRSGIASEQDQQSRRSPGEVKAAPNALAGQRIAGLLEPATVNRYAKRKGRRSTLYRVTTSEGSLTCEGCHARAPEPVRASPQP